MPGNVEVLAAEQSKDFVESDGLIARVWGTDLRKFTDEQLVIRAPVETKHLRADSVVSYTGETLRDYLNMYADKEKRRSGDGAATSLDTGDVAVTAEDVPFLLVSR